MSISRPPAEAGSTWWNDCLQKSPNDASGAEVIRQCEPWNKRCSTIWTGEIEIPNPSCGQRTRISFLARSRGFVSEFLTQDTSRWLEHQPPGAGAVEL